MLEEKVSKTPQKPGVYIFKDKKEKVLYVGKAKKLRNRLKSYFQSPEALDVRKSAMVKLIADFSYIITENELEALILEANLIKQYKPRFNIILRDDKNYPYLKLTMGEEWPRLEVVRRVTKDGSMYFGPYVPAQSMWDALAFIRKTFPIRPCRYRLDKPMRPCIQHQMKRCDAPCAGLISKDDYMKVVDEVRLFLKGERSELLKGLEKTMMNLSEGLKFEEAARVRDRITSLKRVWESQRVIAPELGDLDFVGLQSDETDAVFDIFFVRSGVLTGTRDFYLKDAGKLSRSELMHTFIELFYAKEVIPPDEIIVPVLPNDLRSLKAWLKMKKAGKVEIRIPQDHKRAEILAMAEENAAQLLKSKRESGLSSTLDSLSERLGLRSIPRSIGAFDISTIAGSESVGAFVYWRNGEFLKDLYRHLKIKDVTGIDDYSMMREVVNRTLRNLCDNVPDLILVDGGKGQLETVRDVIDKSTCSRTDGTKPELIGIAKDPDRAITLSSQVADLEDRTPSSLLLKKIRDEVHRFAIKYHKNLRQKRVLSSPLEKIPGIGKKRRLELLRHFGSIKGVKDASLEEIAGLKGFNRVIAERIMNEVRRP